MTYQPKNILITGGAGFIGSHFVRLLLSQPFVSCVVNLDKLTYAANLKNLDDVKEHEKYVFVEGDICDREKVDMLLKQYAIDTIVHFAAESHVDRSIEGPDAFIQTNIVGTFTLLDAAKKLWRDHHGWGESQCRFHHVSTDEVYGSLTKEDPAFTETTPYSPRSPYSASKASSDHLANAYFHTYGLPVTISNCSNNYGPCQHPEKLIPTIIRSCVSRQPIPIYGDGSNIRDWLYVEDHCDAVLKIVQQGCLGETYNIGGNNEWSNLALAKQIANEMDKRAPSSAPHEQLITSVKDRAGHDWRYAIDSTKIMRHLGWEPDTDMQRGLARTLDFYLDPAIILKTVDVI
ncbi:MAG: dTDP-glucose 4,6-dehydratase [Gammaproteobacteria bacterium]